jgi:hypothetical protein
MAKIKKQIYVDRATNTRILNLPHESYLYFGIPQSASPNEVHYYLRLKTEYPCIVCQRSDVTLYTYTNYPNLDSNTNICPACISDISKTDPIAISPLKV